MSDTAARLAAYKAEELRILRSQETSYGDRRLRRADLAEVRKAIKELERQLQAEAQAAAGAFGGITLHASFNRHHATDTHDADGY